MDPVVTPAEMGAIDRDAPEPLNELIGRAGRAVATEALRLLGRRYGARVVVIAGKGNNGADGRSAAALLRREGVRCRIVPPDDPHPFGPGRTTSGADLVIDAAYGTGFRGHYDAPDVGGVPVLAVDIPSGVDGLTGQVGGRVLAATATVSFAALKPGLLSGPGRELAGDVTVVDIGLDCSRARCWHLGPADVADQWPVGPADGHKWQRAVWVVGGRASMPGAPALAAAGAARAGAGYVTVSVPGADRAGPPFPVESVYHPLAGPVAGPWGEEIVEHGVRYRAFVVGPGLATDPLTGAQVRAVIAGTGDQGLVLDGGAIDALVAGTEDGAGYGSGTVPYDTTALAARPVPAVLTPHDGEMARLLGRRPGPDRIGEARALAAELEAVVLAKGPTTVAAHPDGRVLVSTAGDRRLATAGTGDVLAGLVGAALAGGLDPLTAAGLAAELHGRAAADGHRIGLVAGDLPDLVASWLANETGKR